MENREAFTGISAETEEGIDKVNWRQNNYHQSSRGKGYSTRGISRNYQQGSNFYRSNVSRGRGHDLQGGNVTKKLGTNNNPDVQCLLCGLKGHKVATCRKLEPRNYSGRISNSIGMKGELQEEIMHRDTLRSIR